MAYNPYSLEGKTILVTGASSGIGRAAAIECGKLGANVVITARNKERLEETFNQLDGSNNQIIECDLSQEADIDNLVEQIDCLNGLVNNAGYTELRPVQFIKEKNFENLLKVNTVAPIMLLQKLLKKKKIAKGASVVFTSSLAGISTVTPGNGMYAASKGAIAAFVRVAALELAKKRIRVNAVCPGMVNTNILTDNVVTDEQLEADKANYPLGRYGEPRDIALAMTYLLSDASSWVTGTNMVIDGGFSIK